MAQAMSAQSVLFEDEKKFRDSTKMDELVEENMRWLVMQMSEHGNLKLSWRVDFDTRRFGANNLLEIKFAPDFRDNDKYDNIIRLMSRTYRGAPENFRPENIITDDKAEMRPDKPVGLSGMVQTLEDIVELTEYCSDAEKLRVSNLGINEILELYRRLDSDSRFWKHESNQTK